MKRNQSIQNTSKVIKKSSIIKEKTNTALQKNCPESDIGGKQNSGTAAVISAFKNHLLYSQAKDSYSATKQDIYNSTALVCRDRLMERWIKTQQLYYEKDVKRVYYLSLEFLIGRTLGNSLINLDMYNDTADALKKIGYDLEEVRESEWDAGLGNGGLGRLAACFMDSMATLQLPAYGYGIRYEYGMFFQSIKNGFQVETPDNWLHLGNIWEFPRPEYIYPVKFFGRVEQYVDKNGKMVYNWTDTQEVSAMAYDTPIPGYRNNTVNNMRLWSARSSRDFNLDYFNDGDYDKAVAEKSDSETISKVLYPKDNIFVGKELRLKQQYFFVAATLQDIIRRYLKNQKDFKKFPDKVAVQLNDTHPAIAIPELMRLLIDQYSLEWDEAWDITTQTFAYTNHTILPEALERWSVDLFSHVFPRHIQIIYEINRRFLDLASAAFPGNDQLLSRVSIIEEGCPKKVRMANLAVIGSHKVNGVAELHTEILKNSVFKEFFQIWPEKFTNKTNGITQRRWLKLCNPALSDLISSAIGKGWILNLHELKKLEPYAVQNDFQLAWRKVKQLNKEALAEYIFSHNKIKVHTAGMFDIQVKRMHEYKRQLLNVLHVITLYNRLRENPEKVKAPRTVIFAGKAAPGYFMAKLIIKLINNVSEAVNNDPKAGDKLKVLFLRNYAVSNAEKIIPAADLSEQISTAGTEASGTGNMKFSLNGALTIGTLDGANIEIMEEVKKENIFIFGMNSKEVDELKQKGYYPLSYYHNNAELRQVIDMIQNGYFSPGQPDLFRPITNELLHHGDRYCLLADYESYIRVQEDASTMYCDQKKWTEMSILNTARMGKFSTDRTIHQYAQEIWHVERTCCPE